MIRKLLNKAKSVVTKVALIAVSLIGFASAQNAEIKTAMDAIKADASSNVSTMVPLVIAILGVIIGAVITVSVFKKITSKVG